MARYYRSCIVNISCCTAAPRQIWHTVPLYRSRRDISYRYRSKRGIPSILTNYATDEHDKVPTSLTLMNTYLISGGMLFSCCILPLLYFWLCHPVICKYFTTVRISKGEKLALEETQVDEVEQTEFVADEAPDRVNIRRDPLFDDVKIKAFHRRHHHLLRPLHRRQQQQQQKQDSKKVPPIGKTQENSKEINESGSNAPEEKGSHAAESSFHRSGKEQLTSTEITFSRQTQLHAL